MANYTPIGSGYTPIGGQAFVSPKKKFPHLKGIERERALYNQEMNPRVNTQGFGGLADMQAQNAIDPVTNLPVAMSEFDKAQVMANLTKSGEFEAAGLLRNYQQKLPGSAEALMEFRNMRVGVLRLGCSTFHPASRNLQPTCRSWRLTLQLPLATCSPAPCRSQRQEALE